MPLLLFVVFILLPLAELYVIVQVGQAIGILPTLAILLADGFLGAALARSQGRATWAAFNRAMAEGRIPGREVFDGAMVIFGGALLLSPGFLTDVLGIGLLLPPGRAIVRRMLKGAAKRTPTGRPVFFVYDRVSGGSRDGGGSRSSRGPGSEETPGGGSGGGRAQTPPPSWNPPRRSGGDYVEGTAREVETDEAELGSGEDGRDAEEEPRA